MQSKQYILFLSGLDKKVKEADLHRLFNEYPVSYIKIAKDHTTKESFGYAFIGIKNSPSKAEEALNRFNYEKIPGYKKTIRICWYNIDRSGIRNKDNVNVFVKKIPKTVTHKEFHSYYSKFGNIVSLKLAEDEEGETLGYGFVMYENEEEADKAIKETNGAELHGKNLWVGKFIKNKPKKSVEFNNLYVKNIPKEYSEEKIRSIFSKYGELGSCLIRQPKGDIDSKVPEEKKQQILNHQFAFICFKKAESAMKAMEELPFFKLTDTAYNNKLKTITEKVTGVLPKEQLNKFGVFVIENLDVEKALNNTSDMEEAIAKFNENLKEFDGIYLIKDKSDRIECCQALKKSERERKVKAIYEKIKKQIKEKYRLCNLYVKNLPDNFDDKALRELFEQYGPIRSCRAIKKELLTSYLGIKRSVKVFGYVCFNEKQHAHDAKKSLEGKPLGNSSAKLYVDYHQSKSERSEFLKLNMINKSAKNFGKPGKFGDMMNGPLGMPRGMPQMRAFPQGMPGMGPHMLRKLPNYGGGMDMNQMPPMEMFMQQNMQMQDMNNMGMNMGMMNPMMNPMMNQEPEVVPTDPNAKRDYFGEKLYSKISSNPHYAHVSDLFSKIVGIFLDLEEQVIERLINNDQYFDMQVRETMRLLAEKGSS